MNTNLMQGVPMGSRELRELQRMRDMVHGGLVRAVRVNAGLSLREVAQAVGVTPSAVFYWEQGKNVPRGEPAIRYARVLLELEKASER